MTEQLHESDDSMVKYEPGDTLVIKQCGGELKVNLLGLDNQTRKMRNRTIPVPDKMKVGYSEDPLYFGAVSLCSAGAYVGMVVLQSPGKDRPNGNKNRRVKKRN